VKECERCGAKPVGEYGLLDYCAECSADLCAACMATGCCGNVPATSGSVDDGACANCDHDRATHMDSGVDADRFSVGRQCMLNGCGCAVFE
jgi:hypothetical protein